MYGIKEKALGKFLVKIMKIDKNSEDGFNLLNWKLPGQSSASRMAGDFAGRCFEVISKRPFRTDVGNMSIQEVNQKLDELAAAPREENQLPILTELYRRMNAEELMWIIRVILRQMKVGATEKTFFDLWHPDAEILFNVSSSLKRVCWELPNPSIRLEGEERGVTLMQCFQPQLAQFQMHDFKKMVERLRPTEDDQEFWIEEKLDGERMQLHMIVDDEVQGGKRFNFWSRKAKDYTYLYGNGFYDRNGALTQHLKNAFHDGVENIILDGEMITWDPEQDQIVAFGTLKTAALSEQKNPYAGGHRPLFRVFDILLLNDQPLTRYTLRDRRKALEASIKPVHRRFELHGYEIGTTLGDIEPRLREVVAQASEGLVLKNPRSSYKLNERSDDWMKVKPEYMSEFGENLDCLVIGGYYGSGRRGGNLSSFLCGLRNDEPSFAAKSQKFVSFFKVGGGMTANDYATIRHITDGKWIDWDSKKPPSQYIELGGGSVLQREKPDVWIKPEDSFVVEAKAAQITPSDEFGLGMTLRFPRFKRLRQDKDWQSALSTQELLELKKNIEQEQNEKAFKIDDERKKRRKLDTRKKTVTLSGYAPRDVNGVKFEGRRGDVFEGMTFYVITDTTKPEKKTKIELEAIVKAHGGRVVQNADAAEHVVCIADRRTVRVASLQKKGEKELVKSIWIFDCINQAATDSANNLPETVVPFEIERHMYSIPEDDNARYVENVDQFGDSFFRDTTVYELRDVLSNMKTDHKDKNMSDDVFDSINGLPGRLFHMTTMYFDRLEDEMATSSDTVLALTTAKFGGAKIVSDFSDKGITHIITSASTNVSAMRKKISQRKGKFPRMVTASWILDCWNAKTLTDEDQYNPRD